ncbi:MAG TPA: hypothetical protein VEI02_11950 [Planctomycetota bacterium]|nr:hypothetical protein [Planctomycetota bacterium]
MTRALLPLVFAAAAAVAPAQIVGGPLPAAKLAEFRNTTATSLDAYAGRLIVLEFFMYW